jgi:hypothetical protein
VHVREVTQGAFDVPECDVEAQARPGSVCYKSMERFMMDRCCVTRVQGRCIREVDGDRGGEGGGKDGCENGW